jgi:light-regulated signal transduction histidine kinase (bacteriophytochrome)
MTKPSNEIFQEDVQRELESNFHEALEKKVAERTKELKETIESLQRSNRELEQFAYIASHDLQEPLRRINVFIDRIQEKGKETLDEGTRFYLEKIIASSDKMTLLIKDVLNYSRLPYDKTDFILTDLNEIASSVLTDFDHLISQ